MYGLLPPDFWRSYILNNEMAVRLSAFAAEL